MLSSLRSLYHYVIDSFAWMLFSKPYLYDRPYIDRGDFWMIKDISSETSEDSEYCSEEDIFSKSELMYSI